MEDAPSGLELPESLVVLVPNVSDSDLAADARDALAAARDDAADARDVVSAGDGSAVALADRQLAAQDRAASAVDRCEAAADRHGAAGHLQLSYRDELTGTLSRTAGRDQLRQAIERAHRTRESLVVAFLDVDRLKRVNDTQGHAAGDLLLQSVGIALRKCLRVYDLMVRYGGDEFLCALPVSALSEAGRRFADVSRLLGRSVPGASFSVGLVLLDVDETLESVVARADQEMYESRRGPQVLQLPD